MGDFVDRGPAQLRSIATVRHMVDSGAALAVMGNHELNAIAWHLPDPAHPCDFLRSHKSLEWGDKNRKQHAAFLAEVEQKPQLHDDIIDWFLSLPLWLDLGELRVVHACWHGPFMDWLSPQLHEGRYLTRGLMLPATKEPEESAKDNGTPSVFKAVEALTKGIEVPLPAGCGFHDKDGNWRNRVRVRWWDETCTTYRTAAMLPFWEREALPELPLPEYARIGAITKPTLFGHYGLTGAPAPQSAMSACVDYSAGNGGPLVAYRFDGEQSSALDHFVSVA